MNSIIPTIIISLIIIFLIFWLFLSSIAINENKELIVINNVKFIISSAILFFMTFLLLILGNPKGKR